MWWSYTVNNVIIRYNFGYGLAQGSHKRHFLSAQLTYALLQEDYDWLWLVMGLEGFPFVFSYSMVVTSNVKRCVCICVAKEQRHVYNCYKG